MAVYNYFSKDQIVSSIENFIEGEIKQAIQNENEIDLSEIIEETMEAVSLGISRGLYDRFNVKK